MRLRLLSDHRVTWRCRSKSQNPCRRSTKAASTPFARPCKLSSQCCQGRRRNLGVFLSVVHQAAKVAALLHISDIPPQEYQYGARKHRKIKRLQVARSGRPSPPIYFYDFRVKIYLRHLSYGWIFLRLESITRCTRRFSVANGCRRKKQSKRHLDMEVSYNVHTRKCGAVSFSLQQF